MSTLQDLRESLTQRRLQFRGGNGDHQLWDAGATEALLPGTRLILDFGSLHGGLIKWPPGADFSGLQPLFDGEWPLFTDSVPYIGAITCWSLLEGVGVLPFISSAKGALVALGRIYARYRRLHEAARDLLPVWRIEDASGYAPRLNPNGLVYAPAYTALGWLPRDSTLFGPRLVPLARVLAAAERQRVATDAVFETITRTGSVLPPLRGFVDGTSC